MIVSVNVLGKPAPKGSSRAMNIRGRARLIASSSSANAKAQAAWIKAVALSWCMWPMMSGPVRVSIMFRMSRPAGHYGKRGLRASAPEWPTVYPDIDKLVRCTLDALNGLAFEDDSRVVELNVTKLYATPGTEGAAITVARCEAAA